MQKQYTYVPCNIWISHTTGDMMHTAAWKIFQHDFRNENILPHSWGICYPYPGKLWRLRWSNFRDGMYSSQDELDCTTMTNNPQISIYFPFIHCDPGNSSRNLSPVVTQSQGQGRFLQTHGCNLLNLGPLTWWGKEAGRTFPKLLSLHLVTDGFLSQLTCWDKPHHYIQSQGPCSLHFISI